MYLIVQWTTGNSPLFFFKFLWMGSGSILLPILGYGEVFLNRSNLWNALIANPAKSGDILENSDRAGFSYGFLPF